MCVCVCVCMCVERQGRRQGGGREEAGRRQGGGREEAGRRQEGGMGEKRGERQKREEEGNDRESGH